MIVDDKNMSMDELEVLTYSLCFCHQIVTLTTSVPTPLYIAGLYADRGRRLMRHGWYYLCNSRIFTLFFIFHYH